MRLQTPNVQELKNIIKNLSQDVTRTNYMYDIDGDLSKVDIKKSSFVDIDYTVPGVKLYMSLSTQLLSRKTKYFFSPNCF